MRTTGKMTPGRALRTLTPILVLALLAAALLAGAAPAAGHEGAGKSAAKPGKPIAKAPAGTIATATPTFTWSKARGAARYELRVYEGSTLLLKRTGIRARSLWSRLALPTNVDLTWKVRARNAAGAGAWSKSLGFKVVPLSSAKAITAFDFQGLTPPVSGIIDEAAHAIAVTVPYGTSVTALVATFSTTGASLTVGSTTQVSGTTPNNFSNPVTYTVTAGDGTTQAYVVTVTFAANPAKAITAFSFATPAATGVINDGAKTIALTVPYGTNVSALVATFITTGASVAIAGTPQVSGVTANNFSNPVTYAVTAGDASTQAYLVTVTVAAAVIGQSYGGGVIAYILKSGDPGYHASVQHGLIAGPSALLPGASITTAQWSNITSVLIGPAAQGVAIGTGQTNTAAIVGQSGCADGAAYLCDWLEEGGYGDWYLPSKDELNQLYLNQVAIGGFGSAGYWSSSEIDKGRAWGQYFGDGYQGGSGKEDAYSVRAVRAF